MDNMSKTDWQRLDNMKDEDIDTSDIPELGQKFFETAIIVVPIDREVAAWFKLHGYPLKAQVNQVLREYMAAHTGRD